MQSAADIPALSQLSHAMDQIGFQQEGVNGEVSAQLSGVTVRVALDPKAAGHSVRSCLSVPERLGSAEAGVAPKAGICVFHELAAAGHPIVAYGAAHGSVSFGFEWFHPDGAPWRISAERVKLMIGALLDFAKDAQPVQLGAGAPLNNLVQILPRS